MFAKDFYSIIENDYSVYNFLSKKGIFSDDAPLCLKCNCSTKIYQKKDRLIFRCSQRTCRAEQSVRRSNRFFIFQDCLGRCSSKLTISAILEIVYHWVHEQPLHSAAKPTGHSTKTICDWYNLCREVTQREFEKLEKMGRRGHAVQIDECLLQGKMKSNKGRYRPDHPYEKIENLSLMN